MHAERIVEEMFLLDTSGCEIFFKERELLVHRRR
jgi:hypothetical protein